MLSDTRIIELEKDLLELYAEIENDLLISISSRFDVTNELGGTAEWHAEKLAELNAVTEDNKKIIASKANRTKEEVDTLFTSMGYETVEDDEKIYKKALNKGYLTNTPPPIEKSKPIDRIIKKGIKGSEKSINLVNTKALQSSNKEFLKIVNTAFIEVDSGIYSYQTSIRRAVAKLADKGITGQTYKTEAGNIINYQMDAAVRREVVTASLQTARDVQDERAKEYGSDLIEVTSHIGARPKCAHDQGEIYSNSGDSKKHKARSETSEGDADGLFGINCRHQFYPFFQGISNKTFEPEPLKENAKVYEESQTQRYLENEVKKEKRRLIVFDETKDLDAFTKSSVKLKKKEQNLKTFMNKTGREQKPRTQEPRFNRSLSQKAVHANKKAKKEG